ncbi:helix-turn-helix transcriptional regulator [Bradyrhizobium sp. USDA 4452]
MTLQFGDVAMKFLSKKQVCQKTSLSRSTIDRNIEAGKFPRPLVWGFRLMFDEAEVEAWMLARITAPSPSIWSLYSMPSFTFESSLRS